MKTIQLLLGRVRQYWTGNKLVLCLFLVGGIITSMFFAFYFGNIAEYVAYRTSNEKRFRTYGVLGAQEFSAGVPYQGPVLEPEIAREIAENPLVEEVMVTYFDLSSPAYLHQYQAVTGNLPNIRIKKGTNDLNSLTNGIILTEADDEKVGEPAVRLGHEFVVVGKEDSLGLMLRTAREYKISWEAYMEMELPIYTITVYAVQRYDDPETDPVLKLLQEKFPGVEIWSHSQQRAMERNAQWTLELIGYTYAVTMVSFLFLLRYLMDSVLSTTITTMIVGASKRKIFLISFLEVFSLCGAVNGAGLFLHWLLYPGFFSKFNLIDTIEYWPEDYVLLFLLLQAVAAVVCIPFIWKYAGLSPAAARQGME